MEPCPKFVESLQPNEIFVFGSNAEGRHGRGAALQAMSWGAKYGQAHGLQGQTYAIPTKDRTVRYALPISEIKVYVDRFTMFAKSTPYLTYLVTPIGTGLANIHPANIAPLFKEAYKLPNVRLPNIFINILEGNSDGKTTTGNQ